MQKELLPNSLDFLAQLSEQSGLIVFSVDLNTHQIIYLNPAFEQIFDQKREDVSDNPAALLSCVHEEDQDFISETYELLEEGELSVDRITEFRVQRSDESVPWLCLMTSNYEEEEGLQRLSGILADITDEKENALTLNKFTTKRMR